MTDLFAPIARASDPSTSHAGAKAIEPKRNTQASQALAMYRAYGAKGLTDAELERFLGIRGIWKRASDLRNVGLIVPNGEVRDGQRVCVAADV
jgi:hypothetical protein